MNKNRKAGLSIAIGFGFALWGAFVNGVVTMWLWNLHYPYEKLAFTPPPKIPMLLGFLLGFATGAILVSRNANSAIRSGAIFLFIVSALFVFDSFFGTRFLVCIDNYALSFLWALSLIAIGTILKPARQRKNGH